MQVPVLGGALILMWWKTRVTNDELAAGLLMFCKEWTKLTCNKLESPLKEKGFIQTQEEANTYQLEVFQLYLWIVSFKLREEQDLVAALHARYAEVHAISEPERGRGQAIDCAYQEARVRFKVYHEAFFADIESSKKRKSPQLLASAALNFMVNGGKPHVRLLDFMLSTEMEMIIFSALEAVPKFREKYKIRGK